MSSRRIISWCKLIIFKSLDHFKRIEYLDLYLFIIYYKSIILIIYFHKYQNTLSHIFIFLYDLLLMFIER